MMPEKLESSQLKSTKYVPRLLPSLVYQLVCIVLQKTHLAIWCDDSFLLLS